MEWMNRGFVRLLGVLALGLVVSACSYNTKYAKHSQLSPDLAQAKSSFRAGEYETAFQHLQPLADQGNPEAQYALGYLHYYGKGLPENKAVGLSWIRKAAEQNNANAIKALAIYHNQTASQAQPGQSERHFAVVESEPQASEALNTQNSGIDAEITAAAQEVMIASKQPVLRNEQATEQVQTRRIYGPTTRHDTLWSIAKKTRPSNDITVHEMMTALLKSNPEAFADNDVNALQEGKILKIPLANEITALNHSVHSQG